VVVAAVAAVVVIFFFFFFLFFLFSPRLDVYSAGVGFGFEAASWRS